MKFLLTMESTRPLLMHNERLANPLDPIVKEIKKLTSKRKKTDDDHEAIAHLEFIGGLYHDPEIGPYIPGDNVWATVYNAAKRNRLGERVKEAVLIDTDINPLAYKGPRPAEKIWADEKFRYYKSVKVQTSRTMRCRPIFYNWRCEAEGVLDTTLLDFADFERIVENAGGLIGICEWRPRFGRFNGTVKAL